MAFKKRGQKEDSAFRPRGLLGKPLKNLSFLGQASLRRRLRPPFPISVYSHPGSRERLLQATRLSLPTHSACTAVPVTQNWSKWKRGLRRWLLPKSPTFCHVACVDGTRPPFCPLPCPPQCQPVSDFSQQIAEHRSCWFPCLFERCR